MTTRRRRLLLLGLLAVVTVAVLVALRLLWPPTAITRENAEKIRERMTLAKVEAILGGPARDETVGLVLVGQMPEETEEQRRPPLARRVELLGGQFFRYARPLAPSQKVWASVSCVIRVDFDSEGLVESWDSMLVRGADESPVEMLRRWLRL
jgi:hypothetical protein